MPKRPANPDTYTMSLGDHLEELRRRMLLALIAPLPLAIVIFFFSNTLLDLINQPVIDALKRNGLPATLQTLYPAELIVLQMKLSVIAAIVLAFPWILWQLWQFIQPGLYAHERRFVYLLIPGSFILSIAGTMLLYFVMLPLVLQVLIGIGSGFRTPTDPPAMDPRAANVLEENPFIETRTRAPDPLVAGQVWLHVPDLELRVVVPGEPNEDRTPGELEVVTVERITETGLRQEFQITPYVNFVLMLLLGMVMAFQMPMVVVLLGWVGLASADWLAQHRKYAVLILAFISALITPPDVVSMLIMLVPLYGLYELGILLLRLFPAKTVAEGKRWPWKRPHKRTAQTAQLLKPERPSESIARKEPPDDTAAQSLHEPSDDTPTEQGP
jgi:sec-independent protein translocase protein TatC